jgi:hypothetical protein
MVGGFSESTYLRNELQRRLGSQAELFKPDEALSKAVAKGAVAWTLDGVVASRIAKMSYGVRSHVRYRSNRPEHRERESTAYIGKDGTKWIGNAFSRILDKGVAEKEDIDHVEDFTLTWSVDEPLFKDVSLVVYRGAEPQIPEFVDETDL